MKINEMDGMEGTKVTRETSYLCNLTSKNNVMGWMCG